MKLSTTLKKNIPSYGFAAISGNGTLLQGDKRADEKMDAEKRKTSWLKNIQNDTLSEINIPLRGE